MIGGQLVGWNKRSGSTIRLEWLEFGGSIQSVEPLRLFHPTQANSEFIPDAVGVRGGSSTERWRCLSSNSGAVEDLSVVE